MIDALEILVPVEWAFTPQWRFIEDCRVRKATGFTTHHRVDLRRFGVNAAFFSYCGLTRTYDKVSMIGAGAMSYSEMQFILRNLFGRDPAELRLSRVDFAVDLVNVPVDIFHRRVFAPRKLFSCEFGRRNAGSTVSIETIYLGRRPNCFRIYQRVPAQGTTRAAIPPGRVCELTRVERQLGGVGIPECIRTFGLIKNAPTFDPFSNLKTLSTEEPIVAGRPRTIVQLLAHRGFEELVKEHGAHRAIRILNKYSSGNAARIRRAIGFNEGSIVEIVLDLFERHRDSLLRQLEPEISSRSLSEGGRNQPEQQFSFRPS